MQFTWQHAKLLELVDENDFSPEATQVAWFEVVGAVELGACRTHLGEWDSMGFRVCCPQRLFQLLGLAT